MARSRRRARCGQQVEFPPSIDQPVRVKFRIRHDQGCRKKAGNAFLGQLKRLRSFIAGRFPCTQPVPTREPKIKEMEQFHAGSFIGLQHRIPCTAKAIIYLSCACKRKILSRLAPPAQKLHERSWFIIPPTELAAHGGSVSIHRSELDLYVRRHHQRGGNLKRLIERWNSHCGHSPFAVGIVFCWHFLPHGKTVWGSNNLLVGLVDPSFSSGSRW